MTKWSVLCVAVAGWLCPVPCVAAEHQAAMGVGGVNNDPFLVRRMLSAGYEYRPQPNLSVGVDLHYSPDLGDKDWKPLTKQLIEENHVSPDISKIMYAARVGVTVFPVEYSTSTIQTKVGFGTNMGVVTTSDDLQALDTESSDDRAVVTQEQNHPCVGFVLSGEVWMDAMGARIRMDRLMYIETVNAITLEMKNTSVLMVDVMRKF